jgi:energy-coupling factor transporter transmembrane protein EcfT
MQARGYTGGHGRSHYIRLRPTLADAVALAGVALLLAGMALAPFGSIDAYWLAVLAGRPVS